MLACFIGESESYIHYVYPQRKFEEIKTKVDLLPTIINKKNLKENKPDTIKVEVAFCTWRMSELTEEEIKEYFPSLKLLLFAAGSVHSFGVPFLNQGVRIINAAAAMSIPVAQFTLSLIIQLSKGAFLALNHYKTHEWMESRNVTFQNFPGLYDKTKIGLLGAGKIGKVVINYLKSFDVEVWVYDPFLSDEDAKTLNVKKTSLEDIFTNCQVISNHLADNNETKGILNYKLFSLMKDTGSFINTARGPQIVEEDLQRALIEKPLRFAAFDVTTLETYPFDGKFRKLDNCLLFPHVAGYAASEVHTLSDSVVKDLDNYMNNNEIKNEVTLEILSTMA